MNAKVSLAFLTRTNDAILIVQASRIFIALTGNAAYPTPTPTLAEFTAAQNAFTAAVNAAQDSKMAIAVRRQQRAAFVALLRQLAQYVQITCNGDLPTLLSSGFTARQTGQPVGVLPAPLNLRLRRGKLSGELIPRCDKVKKAGAYQWRYATTIAPTVWIAADPTLAANTTLQDLAVGTQYIVQVRAIGTRGPSAWSDSAALMVA